MRFLSLLAAFLPAVVLAQSQFDVTSDIINVGEILYMQPKTVHFELRNTGTESITIQQVNPSCGCTQVSWPKEAVAPEGKAEITATYDARMMGTFQKELEVYTTASDRPLYLTLQGRVVSDLSADLSDDFPIDLGAVRLNTNVVEFDDVNSGDHPEVILQVQNNSRSSYKPQLMHLPPYLSARYLPEQLAGGRVGRIVLRLNSEKLKSHGLTQTAIYLARHFGDKVGTENEIDVSAVLLPAFANLSAEQMATAPHILLSEDSLDFGDITGKKKVTKTITLTNTGQRTLSISRLQVYGKALTLSLSDRTIPAGRQAKLKVTLNTDLLKKEKRQPRVLIICDDPQSPKSVIHVNTHKP